jgi:hypothetical protein
MRRRTLIAAPRSKIRRLALATIRESSKGETYPQKHDANTQVKQQAR